MDTKEKKKKRKRKKKGHFQTDFNFAYEPLNPNISKK